MIDNWTVGKDHWRVIKATVIWDVMPCVGRWVQVLTKEPAVSAFREDQYFLFY